MSEARKTTYRPTDKAEKELKNLFKRFNYSTENGAINDVVENYLRVVDERDKLREDKHNLLNTLQELESLVAQWSLSQNQLFNFFNKPEPTTKPKKK
ncbi:MAG: hypothetical protein AB7G44_04360 [Bacteroidia bacterium]